MTDIKWQEPPAKHGGVRTDWPEIFAALRDRPGQWALVKEGADRCTANFIETGRYSGAARGEFEAVARGDSKKPNIYARFVGGES